MIALAEWHFGGGAEYCRACPDRCPDCPYDVNGPITLEGWQAWQVVRAAGGQLRTMATVVVGLDLGALLAIGGSLGACPVALAEILVAIEIPIVTKINECLRSGRDG